MNPELAKILAIVSEIRAMMKVQMQADKPAKDPVLKSKPRNWTGEDITGKSFSQLPVAALAEVASMFEAFAAKNEKNNETWNDGKPKAITHRDNAKLARDWIRYRQLTSHAENGVSAEEDYPY